MAIRLKLNKEKYGGDGDSGIAWENILFIKNC